MTHANLPPSGRATARVAVRKSESSPFDDSEQPVLSEIRVTEVFTGDIEGESEVRALAVLRADKSAVQVSLQRVRGTLAGRAGSFILQGSETVANGKIMATWSVVPGSGTGALAGLRGEGGFEGAFGKGSEATLDYWFE